MFIKEPHIGIYCKAIITLSSNYSRNGKKENKEAI